VTLVDTGEHTMTGGRLKRIGPYVADTDRFCMTYGDGLADIDLTALLAFHDASGRLATMTTVLPPGRLGAVRVEADRVVRFAEKPQGEGGRINGGFFVLSPEVLDLIDGDETAWEQAPLETLAARGQLGAFRHEGFWLPMDTYRDKLVFEELWKTPRPPWKRWT
jgi:glucose-1-phosphate cytidylyltransferase